MPVSPDASSTDTTGGWLAGLCDHDGHGGGSARQLTVRRREREGVGIVPTPACRCGPGPSPRGCRRVGPVTIWKVSGSPSGSEPVRLIPTGVPTRHRYRLRVRRREPGSVARPGRSPGLVSASATTVTVASPVAPRGPTTSTSQSRGVPSELTGTLSRRYWPSASVVSVPPNSEPTNAPSIGLPVVASVTVPRNGARDRRSACRSRA